jgi:hypothetical protein
MTVWSNLGKPVKKDVCFDFDNHNKFNRQNETYHTLKSKIFNDDEHTERNQISVIE